MDGCAKKREPGYEHMEWLRIQLQILRERNMKAILMGHVPPARVDSKESWDETCWQKYTLWTRQFRDVIVGSLYGHMNIDHFMLQDFEQISKDAEKGRMAASLEQGTAQEEDGISLYEDGEVTVASASDYLLDLRDVWAQLPAPPSKEDRNPVLGWFYSIFSRRSRNGGKGDRKKYLEKIGGKFAQRYGVSLVAPSVVPNYFPTLRIIEYNISGLEALDLSAKDMQQEPTIESSEFASLDEADDDKAYLASVNTTLLKKKHPKKKGPRKYKFKIPSGPSSTSPPGPAYSPQSLTWTRYIQYYANLTRINNDFNGTEPVDPNHRPQHVFHSSNQDSAQHIFGLAVSEAGSVEGSRWKEGKHHKHQGKQPRPEPHPVEFYYEIEYDTKKDRGFKDLTVRRWVEYARRIGGTKTSSTTAATDTTEDMDQVDGDDELEGEEENWADVAGKKHKHKKGKKKRRKASKEWFTFVRRAFVGTMDPHEIKQVFGSDADQKEDGQGVEEVMEL